MGNTPHVPEKKGPIAWMAGHSVAANLVMAVCLLGGLISVRGIKQEVFPDITLDIVSVTVPYPGASPEEVESGILLSIEEAIRSLDGIDEVTSVANEGSGTVSAELLIGEDADTIAQDIQSEIDRIRTFPEDAEEPVVRVASRRRGVLSIALYGDVPDTVLHQLGEQARDRLLQNPNVTQVDLSGVPPLEISIEVPQENLRRYGITLGQVAQTLRNASLDVPGGGLKTANGEILLRVKERRDYGRQFGRIPIITAADGSQVLLRQIAVIDDGFADADRYTRFNGQPAVLMNVFRVGDQTPIEVSDGVKEAIGDIRADLPPGIGIALLNDRSDIYRQRVQLLLRNAAIGLTLVLVVLGLFLEARLAFWVMLGIPISFLGSFLLLPMTGVTINMVSLFAYIIALGIVVDDAIVVGENVYHYHQDGLPFLEAAIRGAREVAMPVTFSILTNIVTFLPLYVVPGTMGKIFMMIPVVVCTVFIISLFESLLVLPAHLGHQRDRRRRGISAWLHAKQQAFSHGFRWWVGNRYGPFLSFVLHHRYVTVALAASILAVSLGYALSGRMGFQLFPVVESDYSQATLVMPYGTPVSKTEAVMLQLTQGAQKVLEDSGHPELVKSIVGDIGIRGSHSGRAKVELAAPDIRETIMSTEEFTKRWRAAVGDVAGIEHLRFASDAGGPGSHGRPFTVQLSHRDIDVLAEASSELAEVVSSYPLVKDVDDGFQLGKQQLDFALRPEGKSLGLTARDIAGQVRHAFYGAEVLRQQRGRNEIKIMVRLPEDERSTEYTVQQLLVRTPAGTDVPLREIADIRRGRAYTTIDRRNGRRVVQVSADVSPRSKTNEVIGDLQTAALPELLAKHPGLTFSFEGHQADMRESVGSLKVTFVMAMLAIYALLAIPFRSYIQPLIVMVSIPFGIVGAIIGHLIMGYNLSIMSMFGIVALSGVVVNDSLVMIDFANRLRNEGETSAFRCVHRAAIQRFRPILLTTLTTFGGLAPMIFETSRQARFLIPMALSLGYGILFATAITLVLVPSLYMVIDDVVHLFCPRPLEARVPQQRPN
ncbi:MAG: efflux RND transporter permease subunit [Lentisphaerae bacterium]|jgi:multidrug efflux pump subunit AcrB|nr:efflux RND transporter permease subunit [Lentisphaerota bacterium]MBT5608505.1 efflux RND transporter permease subunit [Lentisphaerota bacterium]MBT7058513.1 efflux RND transporter permease subunit [Lentisphaerota bacterium]MBT7843222.1 efflux RND transporter permease subunit [Lentisphaerota bacterium]